MRMGLPDLLTLMRMRCSSFQVSSLMRILNTQGLKLTEARMESNSGEAAVLQLLHLLRAPAHQRLGLLLTVSKASIRTYREDTTHRERRFGLPDASPSLDGWS